MKRLLQIKHWKLFIILITLIFSNVLFSKFNLEIGSITSLHISTLIALIYIVILFLLVLNIGLFTNRITENPYKFSNGLIIFSTICCIIGYSELNLSRLYLNSKTTPTTLTFVLPLFTIFGIIYTFYNIPKSLKSIELGRKAVFKEYIIDSILLFALPIGIWFIQPRINKLNKVAENMNTKKTTTANNIRQSTCNQ